MEQWKGTNTHSPLVSVATPVYNGEKYLAECIESVLAQTYSHWDYTIINNRSTDRSLEIAECYAKKDSRVRVITNESFVGPIENYNNCFSQISPQSKYCKVVSADDWLYPDCIRQMVQAAEENPRVGMVGSYAISGLGVRWVGLLPTCSVFSGKEVCRSQLLGDPFVLGATTSVLYSADIIRSEVPFYPGLEADGDTLAHYRTLLHHDLGFVHQILCFERIHDGALSTRQRALNAFPLDAIGYLLAYGHTVLSHEEFDNRYEELLTNYYDVLGAAVVNCNGIEFWRYHSRRLSQIGLRLDRWRLAKAVAFKMIDLLLNPKRTCEKMLARLQRKSHAPSVRESIAKL
ncbi:MAG: glycosyltransferase family 2 protein [Nitrospira sp.]|nr:glycosyltransferase family 2 protein [Nitrospira sp.]